MDDTAKTNRHKRRKHHHFTGAHEQSKPKNDDDGLWGDEEEDCDVELRDTLSKSIRQVQSVLDQNRALIQQANDNHRSGVADNITRNVAVIREINSNISKALSIYSNLSANFSSIVHRRRTTIPAGNCSNRDDNNDGGNRKSKSGDESE